MPMFGDIIRNLLDQKLTTIKEMEEVTGRASSTIYRWMNGESEPHHTDMRLLVRHMSHSDARRKLVSMLTSDLPVVINWIDDDHADKTAEAQGGHEVLDRSLLALDCLSHALSEGNEALGKQELSREAYMKLVTLVDETVAHLSAAKSMLRRYAPKEWAPAAGDGAATPPQASPEPAPESG